MNTLIFVRGIRFLLDNDIGMRFQKIFVIKRDMADDAEAIGNNAEFKDIAEMAVDEELLDLRIGGSMGRHGSVSGFVGIKRFIKPLGFRICLELLDDPVGVFRIIFGNEGFNAGGVKDGHIGFNRVNSLADGFCNINKVIEYELQII